MNPNSPIIGHEKSEISYGSVIKELTGTASDLIQSEISLLKTELKSAAPNMTKHAAQTGIYGALFAISSLPLLTFAVIGLGILFGGMYWLSALVVGALCAAVGGYFGYHAFQKLKNEDLTFTRTRDGIAKAVYFIESKIHEVKNASHGGTNESNHIH
ncbi:MAG: phage holin family protein [Bdellovibrionales bacterium]|nr:phage holin family protein [Oligoflexia bacterium]